MHDHYRASVDLGAPVGEAPRFRGTGVYQNSGSYRDGSYSTRGVKPTASFRIGPDT